MIPTPKRSPGASYNAPSIRVAGRLGEKFLRMHEMRMGTVCVCGMTLS